MLERAPLAVCPPTVIADSRLPPRRLDAGREDTDGTTREARRSMFLHASRRELDDPDRARLPDRVHADLLFELAAAQGASHGEWLGCAAVAAGVESEGMIVPGHVNRVFSDEVLFTISMHETAP
jgi:hypothetical protein